MSKRLRVFALEPEPPMRIINEFQSLAEAGDEYGVSKQAISKAIERQQVCAGRRWISEDYIKEGLNGNQTVDEVVLTMQKLSASRSSSGSLGNA
jgi:hypothetical protein